MGCRASLKIGSGTWHWFESLGSEGINLSEEPKYPPMRNGMPVLEELGGQRVLGFVASRMFGAVEQEDHPFGALISTLARVIDKAVREYEEARLNLDAFVARRGRIVPMVRASDHLETCVGSLVRADRLARTLKGAPSGPAVRKNECLKKVLRYRLEDIRDSAEHVYDQVASGKIQVGEPIMIRMEDRSFALGKTRVEYSELAEGVKLLHALAERLVAHSG